MKFFTKALIALSINCTGALFCAELPNQEPKVFVPAQTIEQALRKFDFALTYVRKNIANNQKPWYQISRADLERVLQLTTINISVYDPFVDIVLATKNTHKEPEINNPAPLNDKLIGINELLALNKQYPNIISPENIEALENLKDVINKTLGTPITPTPYQLQQLLIKNQKQHNKKQ